MAELEQYFAQEMANAPRDSSSRGLDMQAN